MSAHEEHCRCGACLQATIAELEAKIDELSAGMHGYIADIHALKDLEATSQSIIKGSLLTIKELREEVATLTRSNVLLRKELDDWEKSYAILSDDYKQLVLDIEHRDARIVELIADRDFFEGFSKDSVG